MSDYISPRPYKGFQYRVIVDGFEIASFNTLAKLNLRQTENVKVAYSQRLKIPSQRMKIEPFSPLSTGESLTGQGQRGIIKHGY